jgi:carboxymethylenebutenolidase
MSREQIDIQTKDGSCPTSVFRPEGAGPWPAVILFMDGLGIRPALYDMGERLARAGYVVLLPDLFYRAGPYAPMDPKAIFAAGNFREVIGPLMATTNNQAAAEDTAAFLAYLDTRTDVVGKKVGVTGYCMGGGMALSAAAMHSDRIVAAASFHGGKLASDSPMSPHLLAPRMKGFVYVAGADNDDSYPPEMATLLKKALTDAKVDHRCEIYAGAKHGWTMPDFPVYDEAAAERHWRELTALFARMLS